MRSVDADGSFILGALSSLIEISMDELRASLLALIDDGYFTYGIIYRGQCTDFKRSANTDSVRREKANYIS